MKTILLAMLVLLTDPLSNGSFFRVTDTSKEAQVNSEGKQCMFVVPIKN